MPHRIAAALILLSLAAAVSAGNRAKVRRPRFDLRGTPAFAFIPANVRFVAQLSGGDDAEEFYCPALVWDWDDGERSAHQQDCPPFRDGTPVERRFTAEHAYRRPGVYTVRVEMVRGSRAVAAAATTVTVHGMGGASGQ